MSSQQKAVLRVVRNLAAFNGVIIVMLVAYAHFLIMPLGEIVPLVLTVVLARYRSLCRPPSLLRPHLAPIRLASSRPCLTAFPASSDPSVGIRMGYTSCSP